MQKLFHLTFERELFSEAGFVCGHLEFLHERIQIEVLFFVFKSY